MLFAIYSFAVYPAAVLYKTGDDFQIWNLFLVTVFKVIILISLYNVQVLMEDPFNQDTPDGIRLQDFRFKQENTPALPTQIPTEFPTSNLYWP